MCVWWLPLRLFLDFATSAQDRSAHTRTRSIVLSRFDEGELKPRSAKVFPAFADLTQGSDPPAHATCLALPRVQREGEEGQGEERCGEKGEGAERRGRRGGGKERRRKKGREDYERVGKLEVCKHWISRQVRSCSEIPEFPPKKICAGRCQVSVLPTFLVETTHRDVHFPLLARASSYKIKGSTPPGHFSPPMTSPSPASMGPSDQYCLKWHVHEKNFTDFVSEEFDQSSIHSGRVSMSDVTLAFEDGVRLYAHRLVLSSCSQYFYEILKSTTESVPDTNVHPIVIFREVASSDMKLLLEFIYKGTVTVGKGVLSRLISVAKSLKINAFEKCVTDAILSFQDVNYDTAPSELVTRMSNEEEQSSFSDLYDRGFINKHSRSVQSTFAEMVRDRHQSRSSTPVSRSESPCSKARKEEYAATSFEPGLSVDPATKDRKVFIPSSMLNTSSSAYQTTPSCFLDHSDSNRPADFARIKRDKSPDSDFRTNNTDIGPSSIPFNSDSRPESPQNKRMRLTPSYLSQFPPSSYPSSFAPFLPLIPPPVISTQTALDLFTSKNFPQMSRIGSVSVKKDLGAYDEEFGFADSNQGQSSLVPSPRDLGAYWNNKSLLQSTTGHPSNPAYPQALTRSSTYLTSQKKPDDSSNLDTFAQDQPSVNGSTEKAGSPSLTSFGSKSASPIRNSSIPPTSTSGVKYSTSFVNYGSGGSQNKEWKRYKQYTRRDLELAIAAVESGMTALQASRKHNVPSRTLYDKIKKLGISTANRRITSTMSATNTRLRQQRQQQHHLPSSKQLDQPQNHEGNHDDASMVVHHSGGSLVTSLSNSAHHLSEPKNSRPRSLESATVSDSCQPLDLQQPKAFSSDTSEPPVFNGAQNLSQLFSNVSRFNDEQRNRINSSGRLADTSDYPTFAPKSLLDLLPRQLSVHETKARSEEFLPASRGGDDYLLPFGSRSRLDNQTQGPLNLTNGESARDSHKDHHEKERDFETNEENEHKVTKEELLIIDDSIPTSKVDGEPCIKREQLEPGIHSLTEDPGNHYVRERSSKRGELGFSDSPPSFGTAADSGHDSNNDTSAASDSEMRAQGTSGLSVEVPSSSPRSRNSTTPITVNDTSPKVSEPCTSSSEVSPMLSDKSSLCVDSDQEVGLHRNEGDTKYKVPSEIGICTQVRPLHLRESSISIP
ncbi:BTB/POZ domain [Trinorchestia longiramus]|nr:BTB/POZ domain [Trinorchestia longiramus]